MFLIFIILVFIAIEIIDTPRSPIRLEAIYFLQPTLYNVDCITADFTRSPHRYECAHVFFLPLQPPMINEVIQKLENGNARRFLKTVQVSNLDFRPLESQVFTLNDPQALEKLFNPECHDLVHSTISQIASKLVSVCATLGEYPIVRFHKPNVPNYEGHVLSFMIAQEFQNQLDNYARSHPEFLGSAESEKRPRSLFVIADRSIDLLSPFLHEFTYQALAYDVLDFKNWNSVKDLVEKKGNNEKSQMEDGKVTEKDPEWVSLRHSHIQEAIETLRAKLDKLKKDNPNFADTTLKANVNDIKGMVLGLPMFIEQRDRISFHLELVGKCMENVKLMLDMADVEQTLATGLTSDGSKPKTITDDFVSLLADDRLSDVDRLRLVIIYAIFRRGLVEADYDRLQKHCHLSNEDLIILKNYSKLGAPMLKDSPKLKVSKHDVSQRFDSISPDDNYVSSRYINGIHNIIDLLLTGRLSADTFPYIKDQPTEDIDDTDSAGMNSLRSRRQRPNWALNPTTTQVARQRVFVFVVGGITASESRSCYELSKKHSREIIVGSTDITASKQFISALSNLSKPRRLLNLKVDERLPTKAPSFLYESEAAKVQTPTAQVNTPSTNSAHSNHPVAKDEPHVVGEKKKGKFSKFLKSYK